MDFVAKLNAITDAETADCTIVDPITGDPVVILIMAGRAHPITKALSAKHSQRLQAAAKRARDPQKAVQREFANDLDPDVSEERLVEALTARTLGWKPPDGSEPDAPFSAKQMEQWYRADDKGWLRNQVVAFLAADESFTQSSQT